MSRSLELIERDQTTVAAAIYRYTDIAFQRGEGVYLYDFEGRKYLDFGRHRYHDCRTLSPGRGGGHLRPSPHSHPRCVPRGLHGTGIWWAGVSTGLVNDIPSVAELVSRIASDAEKIILERLSGLSR